MVRQGGRISNVLALFIILVFSSDLTAQVNFTGTELLARPTDNSITVNVVADAALLAYFECGTESGAYAYSTSTISSSANEPIEMVIDALQADTRYYYRMVYSEDGGSTWVPRAEHSFHTQRPAGSTFVFTITSDSHINIGLGDITQYRQALNNVAADEPDLHLDLGDTFEMDGVYTAAEADENYLFQRSSDLIGRISHSAPIFLAIGNHENEEGWNFDDTAPQPIFSINARKRYFPLPIPDDFYSGNSDDSETRISGDHLRQDYYAWEWGDALFIVFDPFQYTMYNPYGAMAGEGSDDPATGDRWNWTLGQQQFNWLKQTLENSSNKYKFMFAHHMVGGTQNYVRGGAVPATWFEWGGNTVNSSNQNPEWEFDTKRLGWGDDPIHQLMIDNHVSAFFHGHDHQFVHEERDGIVYQLVPSPCMGSSYGFDLYDNSPYVQPGGNLPNSGHLRVTVSPIQATVEYVNTTTGNVTYSYTIDPFSSSDDPTITITGVPLSTFNSQPGTPSAEQSYTVSGNNLTDDITITAPSDFEISLNSSSGWTSSLILNQSEGSVAETAIYVRFNRATEGTSSGDISHTSSGAIQRNVAVNGTAGYPPAIVYLGDIGTATAKTSGTSLTITTTTTVDEGDDIIIGYASDPYQTLTVTVTDDVGNTYQQVANAISYGRGRTYIFAAYNVAALSRGSTITITGNPAVTARVAVASVFTGLADMEVLDQALGYPTGSPAITSTTPSVGPTGTTTQAGELLIGVIGTEGPVSDNPGTWDYSFKNGPRAGTSGGSANTNWTVSLGYRMVSATAGYTAQKSSITERYWAATIATFKAGSLRYDAIASDYNGDDGFSVSLSHPDGDYFTATATSGTVSALHVYRIDQDANTGNIIVPPGWFVDPLRYWGVRIFGIDPEYSVVYMYDGHPGILNETALGLANRTGPTDNSWEVDFLAALDIDNHTLTLIEQTGTEYALGSESGENSLPVELTSFTAEANYAEIRINWSTESELNNLGFILERTTEEIGNFQEIASYKNTKELTGQGNSNQKTEYFYSDRDIELATTYLYRLADVDLNGTITYHNTVRVTTKSVISDFKLSANYPNPFNPNTTIEFSLPVSEQVEIKVYNIFGQIVEVILNERMPAGEHKIEFNAINLASGIYFYHMKTGSFQAVKKMLLAR